MVRYKFTPGWNPCKPHAEDAPRISKYHAKVFGMTRPYAKPSKYHAKSPKPRSSKSQNATPFAKAFDVLRNYAAKFY